MHSVHDHLNTSANKKRVRPLHAKTVDKNLKEAKKPKTVKFAVDTNDEMIKNKFEGFENCKDQERNGVCKIAMDACSGLNSKLVKSCEWTNCGTRRDH